MCYNKLTFISFTLKKHKYWDAYLIRIRALMRCTNKFCNWYLYTSKFNTNIFYRFFDQKNNHNEFSTRTHNLKRIFCNNKIFQMLVLFIFGMQIRIRHRFGTANFINEYFRLKIPLLTPQIAPLNMYVSLNKSNISLKYFTYINV